MDRHRRATELFLECCELANKERAAFLDERCGEDRELREQVEGMIAFEARRPEFLAASAVQAVVGARDDELPASIGPFRILRKLGQGGMGAVYEAQQERPHRTVALKVLRPFLGASDALRRFEHEGEFLARLQHPGIAQIFGSGRADTERGSLPYFALELVRGDPLIVHARKQHLSSRERLELLARVADAVQHAHQHGVIHRDLKPANILVEESGQPKVLDFGIARASESDVQLATQQTDVGQILGTLAYMSPEQTSGDPAAIDTRSDVYSLGVLLYELLADRLPYDVSGKSLPDAVRIIQEEAPSRLSAVDSAHRGDLETIVRTALEKDKERRYASAEALAADIRRYLRHEPIAARPPSRIYTLSMLVRRNKALAGSLTAGFLLLVAGLIVSLVLRARAERRADEVLRLSAIQRLEDLITEAERLWPPHPRHVAAYRDWITRAEALVAERPMHVEMRAELRTLARARTEEERRMERESHPAFAGLAALESEIERHRRALARRRGESGADSLGDSVRLPFATDAVAMLVRAEVLFAEGLDDLARDEAYAALDRAHEDEKERIEARYLELELQLDAATTAEGLARADEELAALIDEHQALAAVVDERRDWHFPVGLEDARWWNNQITKLIDALDALADESTGQLGENAVSKEHGRSVPRRLAIAQDMEAAFAPGGRYDARWQAALPELALDYPNLELGIQTGLVPIGKDPRSGLWEFWHVQSGTEPVRGADGELQLVGETGLVLVLLRGGTFHMGSQAIDPDQPNYDLNAFPTESPVHKVELTPFLLSKYE